MDKVIWMKGVGLSALAKRKCKSYAVVIALQDPLWLMSASCCLMWTLPSPNQSQMRFNQRPGIVGELSEIENPVVSPHGSEFWRRKRSLGIVIG